VISVFEAGSFWHPDEDWAEHRIDRIGQSAPTPSRVDGYCYRYRPDERPLGQSEGAFLLCGFLMALAYAQQGDHLTAARWFERNRAACGPPGLLSEEFDVTQRQLRGNLPQAFVHALLLECAVEQFSASEPRS
jgi:GH15 family glucan-1,4-alpha-glucosidase